MSRLNFYKKNILQNIQDKNSKILVLGAGKLDHDVFNELGFKNVSLSNYNNIEGPVKLKNLLLQDINLPDNEYDYCVAHACIHHSSKPHNSILEMYRVSKKGFLVIEANDCFLTRLACKLGYAEEFEKSAVVKNKTHGGVDNTNIPNYVFRWTEREVYKLLSSYKPNIKHKIIYNYANDIKFTNRFIIKIFFKIFFMIFSKQQNLFSFFVKKTNFPQ
ncbi:MAG: methyltransferase domain-containing protein [Flavobacteriales bacterium TMED235]|nr:MAG: methyltransferase domain-containing protein [Flavobacteriales bacterium TMED235]|tara:strand:+ start:1926 stop:2576 length:651 start_codon:yes stop_codon:yes gene_type:complete